MIRKLLINIKSFSLGTICKMRYNMHVKHLKKEICKRKLNVIFLVNEISKWKGQSLYELLAGDDHFNPIIGLTCADIDWNLPKDERIRKRRALIDYCDRHKMQYVEVCDVETLKVIDLREFKADIVFYQQPWNLHKKQSPLFISRHHLTCYFPYYVPNYCSIQMECRPRFHYLLWKYYLLNDDWKCLISQYIPKLHSSVNLIATGHPMIDSINQYNHIHKSGKQMVIYAPHWSVYSEHFDNQEKYSTFQHNGKFILEFAKKNSQIEWYFKPHPTLKASLLRTKLWTEKEIEEYYNEWERIGTVCNSDYIELFWKSSVLITDCGSFLVEYPCTKNPIIRLVSKECVVPIPKPSVKLFDSFYNVSKTDEMFTTFDQILIKGLDPKREERLRAVKDAGLLDSTASKNILDDLYSTFGLGNH